MIRVAALGGLRVYADGEERVSLSAKPLRAALLTYLAIERDAPRQRLCALLWPESSPERARHALSQTLYELKKELGNDWVDAVGERLMATDQLGTDVHEVIEAVSGGEHVDALDRYGGPFLDGVSLGGGVEFERWVEDKRSEIHTTVKRAFRAGIEKTSDLDARTELARAWAHLDPLDDEGQHTLIESLALTGDRTGALDQFRVYAELIRTELDVGPLDCTVELVEQIRSGWAGFDGTPAATTDQEEGGRAPARPERSEGSPIELSPSLVVTRLIGIGTTGSVYLAREPALRRLVAVKVLDAELALNPTARARFEREAQAAARIVHPSVATVHQIGVTSDGRPYLVMPYVKGGTLADRMRSHGALPAREVRPILAAAASALAAAHAMGVVHRDVRPANILYDERTGSVYLSDFGIAGVLESGDEELAKLTRSGELLGNAEYVSPEQSRGAEVDDRSDVYSLGILGRALLAGSTLATVTLMDSSDPELVEMLERATSKAPRHRPNAAELAEALAHPPGPASGKGRGLFGEVLRRRMLPYVGAYLAAGIAGMGGIDQLVQQGLLAPVSYRLALAFFVAGLAAALVVAWYHGAKGQQNMPQVERAILALIALGWLVASVVMLV